jgi:hypothetical protein
MNKSKIKTHNLFKVIKMLIVINKLKFKTNWKKELVKKIYFIKILIKNKLLFQEKTHKFNLKKIFHNKYSLIWTIQQFKKMINSKAINPIILKNPLSIR